jgi:iron complex outermembrane receptor protein
VVHGAESDAPVSAKHRSIPATRRPSICFARSDRRASVSGVLHRRQSLDDNPYRTRGYPYVLFGGLIDWAVGRSRIFLNVENLGDVRQTQDDPLVRPTRAPDGRWTVDAWTPLEGRTFNGGVRIRF